MLPCLVHKSMELCLRLFMCFHCILHTFDFCNDVRVCTFRPRICPLFVFGSFMLNSICLLIDLMRRRCGHTCIYAFEFKCWAPGGTLMVGYGAENAAAQRSSPVRCSSLLLNVSLFTGATPLHPVTLTQLPAE